MLRPGRFARPAPVRTFTLELSLPLSPSGASSTTTRVHSQFPWLDFHQLDTHIMGCERNEPKVHPTAAPPPAAWPPAPILQDDLASDCDTLPSRSPSGS